MESVIILKSNVLSAGVSSVDITPDQNVSMVGYGPRTSESISDELLVNALVVFSDKIEWLLLTADIFGIDLDSSGKIRSIISKTLRIQESQITISCSHSHSGPATFHLRETRKDENYILFMQEAFVSAAVRAKENIQSVYWSFGVGECDENVSRRKTVNGVTEMDINNSGLKDSRVRVLRMDSIENAEKNFPLCIVVHYACHPTVTGGEGKISSDWPGAMRREIETHYSSENGKPTICFIQGCAGDITHRIGKDKQRWPDHFGIQTYSQAEIMGTKVARTVIETSEKSANFSAVNLNIALKPLKLKFLHSCQSEKIQVQMVSISGSNSAKNRESVDIVFIMLPVEPFASYGMDLGILFQNRFGYHRDRIIVCGYSNGLVGYLGYPKSIIEGGYETEKAHFYYHRPGPFSIGSRSRILSTSLKLARTISGNNVSNIKKVVFLLKSRLTDSYYFFLYHSKNIFSII